MPDLGVAMEVRPDPMTDEVRTHTETIRKGDFTVIQTHRDDGSVVQSEKLT